MSKVSDDIQNAITGARNGIPRSKARIKPRHRAVLKRLTEGMAVTPAMIASGYTHNTATQGDKLMKSKSWALLMEEQIPEALLTQRHRELLDTRRTDVRVTGRGDKRKYETVDLGVDVPAVKAGLEMAYKLRGKFMNEVPPPTSPTHVYNLFYQPTVQANVRAFEEQLKQAITHAQATPLDNEADSSAPELADGTGDGDTGTVEDTGGHDGQETV